jgi:hypothetical protein
MLTSDLAIHWQRGNRITPRYLEPGSDTYLAAAEGLIAIVREHTGERQTDLDRALDDFIGAGTEYRILRGMIKLLMDRCRFDTVSPIDPIELRNRLFLRAREYHPVNESNRPEVIGLLAQELDCEPDAIEDSLFADLSGNQKLLEFSDIGPEDLLDEYNLAQAQALLYRSVEMTIWIEPQTPAGYRQFFAAIKRYRLIHMVRGRASAGYEVRLSGPVSLFHRSQKYGIRMAVFLPALLECQGWRMRAEIEAKNGKSAFYELDSRSQQLRPISSTEEDVEENATLEKLLAKWDDLGSEWSLDLCREVIDFGEAAFAPDLVARRSDGQAVYIELFGFWTPRYLSDRLREFERGGMRNFLLAASEELRGSREAPADLPANVLLYKASFDARTLQAALSRLFG